MSSINQCILMLFIGSFYLFSCKYQVPSSLRVLVCVFVFFLCCTYYIVIFCHCAIGNVPSLLARTVIRPHCFCVFFLNYHNFEISSNLIKLNASTNVVPLSLTFFFMMYKYLVLQMMKDINDRILCQSRKSFSMSDYWEETFVTDMQYSFPTLGGTTVTLQ